MPSGLKAHLIDCCDAAVFFHRTVPVAASTAIMCSLKPPNPVAASVVPVGEKATDESSKSAVVLTDGVPAARVCTRRVFLAMAASWRPLGWNAIAETWSSWVKLSMGWGLSAISILRCRCYAGRG